METKMIYKQISKVMGVVGAIEKNRKNLQQNYDFRGIDDMYNALNEHLAEAGIFFTSEIIDASQSDRQSAKGGVLIYTRLKVRWTVWAEDGSFVHTDTVGEAMDSGDKSSNKAMSASYKYALMQLFCIPTQDPKDSENDSPEVAAKATPAGAPAPTSASVTKTCETCKNTFTTKYANAKQCYTCFMAAKNTPSPPMGNDIPF